MTGYYERGVQTIIVLRAVRLISRGVRGKVNFCTACVFSGGAGVSGVGRCTGWNRISWRCGMTAGSDFLATGAGTASTWPDGGLIGHCMATIRQLGHLPPGRHPRSVVFGCGALAEARRAEVDLTSCGPRSRSIRLLNCTLVLQLGSPRERAALGVGCHGGRQCHAGLSLASPGRHAGRPGGGLGTRAATVAGLGRRVEPGRAGPGDGR
jgi:hypothetical protein